MKAFVVSLNGKKLCVAGVGDDGVLSAITNIVGNSDGDELGVRVGGLRTGKANEYVNWVSKRLKVGDEVLVKIVDVPSVDGPIRRKRYNNAVIERAQKRHIRESAKEFGWKIITRKSSERRSK